MPRELQGVLEQLELAALEEARRVRVRAHTSRGRPVREFFRVIGDAPGALPVDEGITPGAGGVYDCGNDVEKAARLLGKGRRVALNQPRQVSTLVDDLAAMVEDARKKGKSAPIYDLCRVTVKGTNLFCVESKGIPRIRMPQLKGEPTAGSPADKTVRDKRGEVDLTPSFVEHLKGEGYAIKGDTVPASYLKATQNELNGAKVAGIANFLAGGGTIEGSPLIVDRDNYIVDGHHRWAAQVAVDLKDADPGNDPPMKVLRVDIGIIDLLEDAKKFAAGQGMPQASVAHGGATEHGIGLKEHRLEEFAFPHIGSPLHVHFEPGKHPRGRIGRFIDVLGKLERAEHGSTVTLPHGITVRRDLHGLQVMGGGHKPVELEHHHAVAAEALFRHTVASGEGHAQLLDEIEHARRQAAPTHGGEALHLAGRAREARVDARRNRRGYLEALTPALFEKGKGRRVYAGEKHPRVEAVLRRIEGRANEQTVGVGARRAHRVTFKKGDTRTWATVYAPRDADPKELVAKARAENKLGAGWKPETVELLRIADKSVQRTTPMRGRRNEPALPAQLKAAGFKETFSAPIGRAGERVYEGHDLLVVHDPKADRVRVLADPRARLGSANLKRLARSTGETLHGGDTLVDVPGHDLQGQLGWLTGRGGRANRPAVPPEKPSNDRYDYVTPKKDGEEFGDFNSDDPVEVWLAHERSMGRMNQPTLSPEHQAFVDATRRQLWDMDVSDVRKLDDEDLGNALEILGPEEFKRWMVEKDPGTRVGVPWLANVTVSPRRENP